MFLDKIMNSVDAKCNKLKWAYEKCFNDWFATNFLRNSTNNDPCSSYFDSYRNCIAPKLAELSVSGNANSEIHESLRKRVFEAIEKEAI